MGLLADVYGSCWKPMRQFVMDCTICAVETLRREGISARRAVDGAPGAAAFGWQAT